MNLHRTSGKADWETIDPLNRNTLQKVAAATGGVLTPANIITIIGFGVVLYGLVLLVQEQFWVGLIVVAVGRLLDIADGMAADATGTKSPLGEIFDAAADKIGTILTIFVLIIVAVAPWWVIAALVIPQVIIPLVIFYKRQKNIKVHPTLQGKLSMALTWAGIVGLLVGKALNDSQPFSIAVYLVIGVSLALGLYALWQYSTGRD